MRNKSGHYWKPGLAPGFFLLLAGAGCGGPAGEAPAASGVPAQLTLAGHIDLPALDELSGMAQSGRDPGLLWVHNDSGDAARLYAIGADGTSRGQLDLDGADPVDWEDLAAYSRDGRPYLLVADIGDNESRRPFVSLYVIAEPPLADGEHAAAAPERRIDFRYPDGPRDAEAVAVDAGAAYILSKRDLPSRLYRVPLDPPAGKPLTAARLDTRVRLPQPARQEVQSASLSNNWYWQPTAMDVANDGSFVAVLTYGAVYYFPRAPGAGVEEALAAPPLRFPLREIRDAEALSIGSDSRRLYFTVEQEHAPLYRIDLEARQE